MKPLRPLVFFPCFLVSHLFAQTLLRRSKVFGLHFDFQCAVLEDTPSVKTLTDKMIDSLLTKVKPDFIQVDCKGHEGVTSYPTKVGHTPKRFEKDILKLFPEVTRRHGVALYVHYSGVWDNQAVKHHPNWARIDAADKIDPQKTSLWSAYSDSLLIPQLKEISDYGVDGVWVDGDCWATNPDYCTAAMDEFRFVTGIKDIPRKTDPTTTNGWSFTAMRFVGTYENIPTLSMPIILVFR